MATTQDMQVSVINNQEVTENASSGDSLHAMTADKAEELNHIMAAMKLEDEALALAIDKERETIESAIEKMHRVNNFRIDEAHVREAGVAEGKFLLERQDGEREYLKKREVEEAISLKEEEDNRRMLELIAREQRSLKLSVRQKNEASEKVAAVKRRLAERRVAFVARLAAMEVRQERERKSLHDSQQRILKNTAVYRKLLLKDYEDEELDKFASQSTADGMKLKLASSQEAQKVHDAKMLQLKLRMQKEVEQLREEHLLKLKHMQRICDLELEQVDELENLSADQKIQELELEAESRKEADAEQDQANEQHASLKAFQTQRALQLKAARTISQQRHEARGLQRQQKIAAKARERAFYESEAALQDSIKGLSSGEEREADQDGSADGRSASGDQMDGSEAGGIMRSGPGSEAGTDYSEMTTESELETRVNGAGGDTSADIETELKREKERADEAEIKRAQAADALRIQQRDFRESIKREHAEAMATLLGEQEDEYRQLKAQHRVEMDILLNGQSAANALEADNEVSNQLLYGMLPRYVADELKMGNDVEPKDFACVTILQADIVQFTNLTANSSCNQIVSLLNRLYTAFDAALDDYQDIYKTETVGDAYQIVGGLNSSDNNAQRNAIEIVDCGLRFSEEVRRLDMTDQIQPELLVRIGVHSGPCVGGVAGVTMPKFAIFGDTVNISAQMEQKARPNRVHISQATYDLVKDAFTFDDNGNITIEGGVNVHTYFVTGRKAKTTTDGKPVKTSGANTPTKGGLASKKGQMDRIGRPRVSLAEPSKTEPARVSMAEPATNPTPEA